MTDYDVLREQISNLIAEVPYRISNMANISSALYNEMEDINWAGFYLLEGEKLILGPFCGRPACITIPVGKGVCGTSVKEKKTILVKDVERFKGHIACDSASRSEIVIPIFDGENIWGVLDIDSPIVGRFSEDDRAGLEKIVLEIEKAFF